MRDLISNSLGMLESDTHYGKRRPGQSGARVGEGVAA